MQTSDFKTKVSRRKFQIEKKSPKCAPSFSRNQINALISQAKLSVMGHDRHRRRMPREYERQ